MNTIARSLWLEWEQAGPLIVAAVERGVRMVQLSLSIDGYDIAWDTGEHADLYPRITCPSLVVSHEHDLIYPPTAAREAVRAMPDARFIELPGLAHGQALASASAGFCSVRPEATPAAWGTNTTGIDFDVGVPAMMAVADSGTSGLVSG